jgi:hypothetical protein
VKYIAVVAGVCMLLVDALIRVTFGVPLTLASILWDCAAWVLWIVMVPVIVRTANIVRYRRGARLRFIVLHSVMVLALTTVQTSLYVLLRYLIRGIPGQPDQSVADVLTDVLPLHLALGLFVYGQTVLMAHLTFALQASAKREEERLALERWLAQAERDLYKLQLPADIVTERLLEIERTIPGNVERAELLIEQFGASLRQSLAAVNVNADLNEIAYAEDELEVEEEMRPGLPLEVQWSLRLLLLFSIVPVVHFVINAIVIGTLVAAGRVTLARAAQTVLTNNAWSAVSYFPVTLAMVWLGSRVRRVTVLAAVAVALSFAWHMGLVTATEGFTKARQMLVPNGLFLDFLLTFAIALGALTYARYRTWREKVVEVAQLESRVLRTRSTLLRLQLNPHFLFNSLNSVAALLDDDVPAAQRMTAELRHFVVRVLESSDREEVPLSEELDSLAAYVAIENVRFSGRADLVIEASDDAREAFVPSFLLQPLVENALRHGLLPETGGRVTVQANVRDGMVHIAVDDDGHATDSEVPGREGLGLSNTRARLAQMYGDRSALDVAAREHGFGVAVGLPYRRAR